MIYVVARDRQDLYDLLLQEFADEPEVQVVVDQRRTERRQENRPADLDRRLVDRRARRDADYDLRSLGWILIEAV
jgi:hypothetical protein